LFVSHNMDLIPRLCQKAFLLDKGRVKVEGAAGDVVEQYLGMQLGQGGAQDLARCHRGGDGRARFTHLSVLDDGGQVVLTARGGDELRFRIEIEAREAVEDVA